MKRVLGPLFAGFTFLLTCLLFTSSPCSSQPLAWAKAMGGIDNDRGYSIGVDAAGNVYTTGTFRGTADFDPGPGVDNTSSTGGADYFICKTDAAGNFLWQHAFGSGPNLDDAGLSIVVDAAGNAWTTGRSQNETQLFVLKYNSIGWITDGKIWDVQSATGKAYSNAIAVDAAGYVYVVGTFENTVNMYPPPGGSYYLTSAGAHDAFVLKLTPMLDFVWAKQIGGTGDDVATSIALDALGNIYLSGSFSSTADFDPGSATYNLTSKGAEDAFIAKLSNSGDLLWAKSIGGTASDMATGLVVNRQSVYTTGVFENIADADPGAGTYTLTSAGSTDNFILKTDTAGTFIWARQMGNSFGDSSFSIAADAAGNVYTTGYFQGTVDFDPGTGTYNLTSAGGYDAYVLKLDSAGNFAGAVGAGGTGEDAAYHMALDAAGNMHVIGYFEGVADFDPQVQTYNLSSAGGSDIFVQKLSTLSVPLHLLTFTATLSRERGAGSREQVSLRWTSENEINFDRYEMERSIDGRSFSKVKSQKAKGKNGANEYAENDDISLLPTPCSHLYYRLKMLDKDGSYTYSKVVAVSFNATGHLQVYPNPASNVLYVELPTYTARENKTATLQITDAAGKIVKQQTVLLNGAAPFSMDIHTLAAGKYFVALQAKSGKDVVGFVKE